MDLRTRYLGLDLPHPLLPGASPLTDDLAMALRLEDAGAAAIVMPSLFEEQIRLRNQATDRYLERLTAIKRRTSLAVIGSLNGTTAEWWLQSAGLIARAGADAMELNVYDVATDPAESAAGVEARVLNLVAVLKESVRIPLAVKLVPFYSSLPHFAGQLDRLGADGLVIFNRSYAPDVDPATLRPRRSVPLSARSELALRVRWLAILRGHIRGALAVTGGVYTGVDAAKAILAGADAVQLVSALLRYGPSHLRHVRRQLDEWGDAHGFASIQDMRGRASLDRQKASDLFTRGHYVRLLQSEHQGV